jgi:3-hydroxybutyryl-CoA dehydrogenase
MVYDISDDILEKSKTTFKKLEILTRLIWMPHKTDRWDNGPIEFFFRFGKAVANADLVIESVPEDPSIKKKIFIKKLAVAPRKPFSLVILLQCSLASLPNR